MTDGLRHKQQKDENFPVASFLFNKQNQDIVSAYYDYARCGDDIADDSSLPSAEKLERLKRLEDALLGKELADPPETIVANRLRNVFLKENLSFSLATDLLTAFRQDAEGFHYETWGQLVNYCRHSAAPVGRFLLALHDENPSTYLPSNALCAALQIVNHIQDLKYDAKILKRVYIPDELFEQFKVKPDTLTRPQSSAGLKLLIAEMTNRVRGLLKDAEILPGIVKSRRLRMVICIIFSLTNIMVKKILKGDVLAQEIKLNKWDWLRATFSGVGRGLFIRRKTLTNKGL